MTLFENGSTSSLGTFRPTRPVLKRAQTPYGPTGETKRRRTSPTGAFSRLSISATAGRGERSSEGRTSAAFQFGAEGQASFAPVPPRQPSQARMRTAYSASEIAPDRIFVEALSDGEPSPPLTPTSPDLAEPPALLLSPQLARQLAAPSRPDILLNSATFLPPDLANHQLVLYRRPRWPPLHPLPQTFHPDEPRIVEIDDDDDIVIQPPPSPPSSSIDPPAQIDSMELD